MNVHDADFEQNQPSGAESIEMHVSLTSKYGSRVLLATYIGYSFDSHRYLIKKSDYNVKLLSTKATFGFVSFANLLVTCLIYIDTCL